MVRQKTDGGSPSGIPEGPNARGFGAANLPNPKPQPGSRPDSNGPVPGTGDAILVGDGMVQTSNYYADSDSPNQAYKGDVSSEPSDATINRGYTDTDMGVPTVRRNTGANRQRFGIDPGADVLEPPGDTTGRPVIPHYGTGTTGD